MKTRILAFIFKILLVFFLSGCKSTDVLASETPTPGFQRTNSTKTPTPGLPPKNSTKTPSNIIHDSVMIALASKDYGDIFLVELATGERQRLEINGDTAVNVVGWAKDACTLFVETEKQRIIKVAIKGNAQEEIANFNSLDLGGATVRIRISPDGQWMALILGTGNQEFASYEFQNLVTIPSQNSKEIVKLTEHGAVHDVAWNIDSTLVAFTDIDNENIQQIFISSPSGSGRTQLTHFNKMSLTIKSLKWSLTGEKIAFVIVDEVKRESYLGIVKARDTDKIILITSLIGVNEFFWLPNERIIADVLPSGKDSSKLADRAIAWFDSDTGQEVGRISPEDLPGKVFQLPGPLANSNRIGFISAGNFLVYDTSTMQVEKGFDIFTDMRYWISAPKAIDAESCKTSE